MPINKNDTRRKIWFSISVEEILPKIGMPGLTPEFVPDVCQYNPQKITEVLSKYAQHSILKIGAEVTVIAATLPMMRREDAVECVVVLVGEPEELEKVVDHGLPFERMANENERQDIGRFEKRKRELVHDAPTQYEKMKQSAFNLMRKKDIKSFSDEELHRVFKHAKEQLLYTSIVRMSIEDGLTISSLYEQDRDLGFER
ncbi:MAG: hypothetical protein ABIQ40_03270 [Bacteroidia bacterium]